MNAAVLKQPKPAGRFTKIGKNGKPVAASAKSWVAVMDNRTGLMWQSGETEEMEWKGAGEYASKLDLAGFTDWRLPTVEELFLLADRTKFSPAIDTAYFPKCQSSWYWSSTVDASSPGDYAWLVYFSGGGSIWGLQNYGLFVRAVRVGQSLDI